MIYKWCCKCLITGLWSPGVYCDGKDNPEAPNPSQSFQSDSVWKQTLPDAIEDQELRSTVASVLEGAEDVLSVFFTNPSSTLRKVKTDRVKRKPMVQKTKDEGISADTGTSDPTVSSEQKTAHQKTELPPKPGDVGITQWSPLSLSEIPLSTGDKYAHNIPTKEEGNNSRAPEELLHDFNCGEQRMPRVNTRHTGLPKKKRKFVYTVEAPKRLSLTDTRSQRVESFPVIQQDVNVTLLAKAREKVSGYSVKENDTKSQADLSEESLHVPVKTKLQDLDISQLSKDFAQDFSQIPELSLSKDAALNVFSPSACLTALKRANKERQADISHECDVSIKSVIATNQNSLINESTMSDSGFQSAVGNGTHITVSSVCEADVLKIVSSEETGKNLLGSNSISPVIKAEQTMSAKGPVNWMSPCGKDQAISEKTYPSIVGSGFKTASNKGIPVLSSNLERAKRIFEETLGDPNNKCINNSKDDLGLSRESTNNTSSNSNQAASLSGKNVEDGPHLTASQKADMTELCTLLEEADSQFDFTQFRTAEAKQPCQRNTKSPEKPDKDLDADFLTGIDFDDSFNSDAEKHLAQDKKSEASFKMSNVTCESTILPSDVLKAGISAKDVTRISQGTSTALSTEQHLDKKSNMMPGVGFQTAGGNILKVSKQCLSKAKALFADLEPHFISGTSQSKQSNGMDSKILHPSLPTDSHARLLNFNEESHNSVISNRYVSDREGTKDSNMQGVTMSECQNGFQLASGKVISVSEKALQDATAFFSDCDTIDNSDTSMKHKEGMQLVSGNDNSKSNFQKCKNVQGLKMNCLKTENSEFEKKKSSLTQDLENGNCGPLSSPTKAVSSPFCTASKHTDPSFLSVTNPGKGFCRASGDKVVVSAEALNKARCLFNDISTLEDTNQFVTSQKPVPPLEKFGFQTASGKGVSISHAALRKAKSLLQDCGEDEVKIDKKQMQPMLPAADPPARNSGFRTASGKAAGCSSEALQKAKALFSDITSDVETVQAKPDEPKWDDTENKQKINCGFSTAGGAKVHISQKSISKAKKLFREFDSVPATENQELDYSFKGCDIVDDQDDFSVRQRETRSAVSGCDKEMDHHKVFTNVPPASYGFSTASGRKVSVSDEAMMKAKSLLEESVTLECIKEHQKPKIDTYPAQNCGFQTARGKGYNISSAALQKAKTLFSESEQVEDKTNHSKIPFLAGSGKNMYFSPETPWKAQAVGLSSELSDTKQSEHEDTLENKGIIHSGFSTAGGAKVHVSEKSLLKAKSLLNDIPDGQSPFSNSCSTSQHDTENLFKSRNLPTSDKNTPRGVRSSNSSLVNKHKENASSGVSSSPFSRGAEKSGLNRTEMPNVTKPDGSSFLCFQSFDINDCSETQQRFLAQEALDCTKALLEDESLLLGDDPQPSDRSANDRKRRGKRLVDGPYMTGKYLHR